MLFFSYQFIFIFLPLVLLGSLFALKFNKEIYFSFLIISSFIFYACWKFSDLYLLIGSIFINYMLGKKITENQSKFYLVLGISINLLLLILFKYLYFFNSISLSFFGLGFQLEKIILPLAISFYTFEQIAYLVDSYKNLMIKHTFLEYVVFISFFPRLIAGPIVQPKEILQQLKGTFSFKAENISMGLTIFVIGLFKKLIIADYFSFFVDSAFSSYSNGYSPGIIEAWSASLAYAFQIYFDFSGYSDMAIGIALLFSIKLPINFNSPYKSKNIIDFWRRWHISLSSFLRDYLYIPLGGNRKGKNRRNFNLLVVMLLGGLWHGANWTFIIWGFIHGSLLIINNIWTYFIEKNKLIKIYDLMPYKFLSWIVTFASVLVAWVYFRSDNLTMGNKIVLAMFGMKQNPPSALLEQPITLFTNNYYYLSLITLLFCVLSPNTQQWINYQYQMSQQSVIKNYASDIIYWRPNVVYAFFTATLFTYCLLSQFFLNRLPPFIYFNF